MQFSGDFQVILCVKLTEFAVLQFRSLIFDYFDVMFVPFKISCHTEMSRIKKHSQLSLSNRICEIFFGLQYLSLVIHLYSVF